MTNATANTAHVAKPAAKPHQNIALYREMLDTDAHVITSHSEPAGLPESADAGAMRLLVNDAARIDVPAHKGLMSGGLCFLRGGHKILDTNFTNLARILKRTAVLRAMTAKIDKAARCLATERF